MNLSELHRTVPEAEVFALARLDGYEVDFTLNSAQRAGGVADIVEASTEHTLGILWSITDFKKLDQRQGVPLAYERFKVNVILESGITVEAQTYQVRHKEPARRPTEEYMQLLKDPVFLLPLEYTEALYTHADSLLQERKVSPDWRVESVFPKASNIARTFFNSAEAIAVFRSTFAAGGSSKLYHQPSGTLELESIQELDKLNMD